MSFKSKQRAKHSHLFGFDDPLTAAAVETTSDDPLFAPRTSSMKKPRDPLSDTTRSPRNGPLRTSIFGDIDVSKLNGARSGGLRSSMGTSSPSSSSSSIRGVDEDDEESLFGKVHTKRVSPPPAPSPPSPASPIKAKITSPASSPAPVRYNPAPPSSPPSLAPPASAPPSIGSPQKKEEDEPPSTPPSRPSSSIFASASRFIKIRTKSVKTEPDTPVHEPKTSSSPPAPQPQPQIPPPQPPMPRQNYAIPSPVQKRPSKRGIAKKEEEEKEEEERETVPVIEDEATRAFAADVMSFKVDRVPSHIDYASSPELQASLTKDTLQLSQPALTPSASTPTTATMNHESLNPWSENPLGLALEPSVTTSTPLRGQRQSLRRQIAPTKRDAFADLISSWNGEHVEIVREEKSEDQELFLENVAAERRDIGFAGISNEDDESTTPDNLFVDLHALNLDDPWC
ncbi:hypothetical protein DFQ28_009177 [Apophysomyces sp. BC1034]|nr:hypothetical protein DFQ30_010091 [Apophysomyces sp. BC1015]KAG0176975.1 hypothetical protein DFQ29_005377 [Apophysomyces sp. BC1021]KAG0192452.1 hypothetical protein DFQ28_009177 [Apophysomyces sp. BC1034]